MKATSSYKKLIGKKVLVIFADSKSTTARREGILVSFDPQFITLQGEDKLDEVLPCKRIIRIKEIK